MSASRREKDREMAKFLKDKGIWHGKRVTTPMHNNYPKSDQMGSAAYRRRMQK